MGPTISEDKITFYRHNGFVQIDNVLTNDELNELRGALEEVLTKPAQQSKQTSESKDLYYRVLNQRVNTWRDHGVMARYAFHARFAELAKVLSGVQGVRFFHDHALLKMPGDSKPTPWHQDLPYWPMKLEDGPVWGGPLSIWIALDDVDENNGCMMFVPTSHTIGKLTGIDLVQPQDLFAYAKDTDVTTKQPVIVRMKAGSCTFHNGLTFHYAHANVTDKPRRVLAIIYMPDGTIFTGAKHAVTDNADQAADAPFAGGLFPILA